MGTAGSSTSNLTLSASCFWQHLYHWRWSMLALLQSESQSDLRSHRFYCLFQWSLVLGLVSLLSWLYLGISSASLAYLFTKVQHWRSPEAVIRRIPNFTSSLRVSFLFDRRIHPRNRVRINALHSADVLLIESGVMKMERWTWQIMHAIRCMTIKFS